MTGYDSPFHGGVRSIAFHPDFSNNGKLDASLLEEQPVNPEEIHYLSDAATLNADSVLVEWTVDTQTMSVDPTSYREVFRVGIPEYDHPIKRHRHAARHEARHIYSYPVVQYGHTGRVLTGNFICSASAITWPIWSAIHGPKAHQGILRRARRLAVHGSISTGD